MRKICIRGVFAARAEESSRGQLRAMLSNAEIAEKLLEIRTLMEMAGATFYKYAAFEKAAASVENAPPLRQLSAAGELTTLPAIGKSIALVIEQLLERGGADALDELHAIFPPTIVEVLGVSGIGAKTAVSLWNDYGIGSLADLEAAIAGDVFAGAPRLGPKTIDNWRRGILAYKGRQRRTPLARALTIARDAITYLNEGPPHDRLVYAGSARRQEVTVGDIDLVCTAADAAAIASYFATWDRAGAVLAEGATKTSIWLEDGFQIDLRVLPDHLYGNLLQHFTGSREHNIKLREYALRRGLRVSENGILNLESGQAVTCAHEEEVYTALGMAYIPPELRSGLDEIDLALAGALPDLVRMADMRGDLRTHGTWSDGWDVLESMIVASKARGDEYQVICGAWEHEQRALFAELATRHGMRALCASEVDILPDGSLAQDRAALEPLELVIASVHADFDIGREAMTARLIRACENPYVSIIAHPTGRILGGFPGYEFDHDAVFAAAARTGTALEIDGQALRLDLPAPLARRAKGFGVTFSLASGANVPGDLAGIEFAVGQARRAGLTKEDILNARPLEGVRAFLARKRSRE
jgi:DNA polymerase (family 10)